MEVYKKEYSPEFKARIVGEALEGVKTYRQIGDENGGIHPTTICRWISKGRKDQQFTNEQKTLLADSEKDRERLQENFNREIQALKEKHEKEVQALHESYQQQIAAYKQQIQELRAEIGRFYMEQIGMESE